ncbi:g6178 [Coccomyxa viridis]|uniref:G6178 protein n=1 Tax=Coccomyxa viridis TaxID=1274662 RepID=A0ABP1FX28_9CHLO
MTRCAGTCSYGNGAPVIKLSAPLMKYRTTEDMKDTLLHEMIHAYLFTNGQHRRDGDHGPRFNAKMHEINSSSLPDHQRPAAGYKLDVYHTFHAEVREHQKHHWRCQRCGDFIQRAMNRPPQEADCRARLGASCMDTKCHYHVHKKGCGGIYIKVAEPEGFGEKQKKGKRKGEAPKFAADSGAPQATAPPAGGVTLDSFFKRIPKQEDSPSGSAAQQGGQASASALPAQVAEDNRLEKATKDRGHTGDSAQERRERLMRAAQQRLDMLKAEAPSSSSAGEGPAAVAQVPQTSNGNPTLEQQAASLCAQASAQRGSNGSESSALKRDIAETLHAPKRRRRQPEQPDVTGDGGDRSHVSTAVKSEASSDEDVIEVTDRSMIAHGVGSSAIHSGAMRYLEGSYCWSCLGPCY